MRKDSLPLLPHPARSYLHSIPTEATLTSCVSLPELYKQICVCFLSIPLCTVRAYTHSVLFTLGDIFTALQKALLYHFFL